MEEHHTKYRKAVLVGEVAALVEAELHRLCKENGWEIGALSVQEDHVHLFLSAPPRVAPALIANTLKGITARQVFRRYPAVKKQVGGGSFWSRSYLIFTGGERDTAMISSFLDGGR